MHKRYNKCPIKIPASGKKLFSIGGVELFFRPQGNFTEVYDVKTTYLIMSTTRDKQFILQKCLERLDKIKALHD